MSLNEKGGAMAETEVCGDDTSKRKPCEQCHTPKYLSAFHRRNNKTDGRMRICAQCYLDNLHETQRRQRELQQRWEQQRIEEKRRRSEESQRVQATLPTLLPGGTKVCEDCKQEFPVNERGHLVVPFFDLHDANCERCGKPFDIEYTADGTVHYGCPGHGGGCATYWHGCSEKYCPTCREERRAKNRQSRPRCPMCNTPNRVWDFLREYHGYHLDLIRVCCTTCIPRFEALPEVEQVELLRRAMVSTYGETAVIYALQYDDYFPVQHIGRTKHYSRRMTEYRRNWHTEIKHHFILEELSFGPLSMERESRWMMHALKHRWPIDNFERLKSGEDGMGGMRQQARLTEAVQAFEPLTAPFEMIAPFLKEFLNTRDAHIVHWFVEAQSKKSPLP
jgi:hypothetical protein